METPENESTFEFIVSTPTHNASTKRHVQRFVRKHVMRKFRKRGSPPTIFILQDEELVEYLAAKPNRSKMKAQNEILLLKVLIDTIVGGHNGPSICQETVAASSSAAALLGGPRRLSMVTQNHLLQEPSIITRSTTTFKESSRDFIGTSTWRDRTSTAGDDIEIPARPIRNLSIIGGLGAGRSDPFIKYPITLNLRAKQLIDCLFHDRVGKSAPYREAWFHTSLMDAGAFHQLLCLSATYLNSLQKLKNPHDTKESLAHHAYAVRLVNSQMHNIATVKPNGILSAIAGFASYYHVLGNLQAWKVHILGLKEIIRIHGRFDEVYQDESLSIILTSVDISGSCDLDIPAHFPFPECLIPGGVKSADIRTSNLCRDFFAAWRRKTAYNMPLMDILNDLMLASLNLQFEIFRTHGKIYSDCVYNVKHISPILHRLLSFPSEVGTSVYVAVTEILRLGFILYVMTIRFAFGILTARAEIQLEKLKTILRTWESNRILHEFWEETGLGWVEEWVLAIAMVAASRKGGVQSVWFKKRFVRVLGNAGSLRTDEFENKMRKFLWIEDIHAPILRTCYNIPDL